MTTYPERPSPVDSYPQAQHAANVIFGTYGDSISIDAKNKDLRKWGARTTVGAGIESVITTVGSETGETFVGTNAITTMVSSDAADTQNVSFYEGHTISGGDATFFVGATTALAGTTPVTLPTACFRISRARLASPATGNIYFYQGGTRTDATTHLVVPAGDIQTQKAATTVSSQDYWLITGATGSVLEKVGAWASFRVEIKPIASTYFYPITQWVGTSDASGTVNLIASGDPWLIVPPNHDVRMAVQANAANVDVAAGIIGVLASVT